MPLPEIVKPSSLPPWLARGHQHEEAPLYGHAEMSTGHSRTRRLWTAAERRVQLEVNLSAAQMADFHHWHEHALLAGLRPYAEQVPAFGPGLVWFEALLLSYRTTPTRGQRTRLSVELLLRGAPSVAGPVITSAVTVKTVALEGGAVPTIVNAAASLKSVALAGNITDSAASLKALALEGGVTDTDSAASLKGVALEGEVLSAPPSNAEAASLLAAMRAWWDFEEDDFDSTFYDAHGNNDLSLAVEGSSAPTNQNTATGLVGRAFSPTTDSGAATAYVPRSNTALDLGDTNWTYWTWVKTSTLGTGTRYIMGRAGEGLSDYSHALRLENLTVWFQVSEDGGEAEGLGLDSGVGLHATLFTLVAATLDRSNDQIVLRCRRSDAGAATKVSASYLAPPNLSTPANFGINDGTATDGGFYPGDAHLEDAAFDSAGVADKAITDAEFDYLFNAGAGKNYGALVLDAG